MNIFDRHNDLEMLELSQPRYATIKAAPTEYSQRCGKCGGSGMYYGMSRYGTRCFACNGAGHKTFKTSPEARAKAAEKRVERKEAERLEKATANRAWQDENRDVIAWIENKVTRGNDFAISLSNSMQQYGKLTDGQVAAVRKCIERDTPASKPAEIVLKDLHTVLQRHSKFYAGDITLSRRNGDQLIWIKHANAEKVLGKIDNGVLSLWNRPGVDNDAVRALLNEFEANPLVAAVKYGKLSGRCCSCGRELTNDGSIEAGIGPICAEKFA